MNAIAAERHLSVMFDLLMQADKAGERRELINAALRIVALAIDNSVDPEGSKQGVFRVIEAALEEATDESIQ